MAITRITFGARLVGLAYVYGLVIGAFSLAWEGLFHRALPTLTWWQWLLAPFPIGVLALACEGLYEYLQKRTGFGEYGESRFKRFVHLAIALVVFAVIIIGPAMYRIAKS